MEKKLQIPHILLLSIRNISVNLIQMFLCQTASLITTADGSRDCDRRNIYNVFIGFSIIDCYLLPLRSLAANASECSFNFIAQPLTFLLRRIGSTG